MRCSFTLNQFRCKDLWAFPLEKQTFFRGTGVKTLDTVPVERVDGCTPTAPNPSLCPVVGLHIVGLLMPRVAEVYQWQINIVGVLRTGKPALLGGSPP